MARREAKWLIACLRWAGQNKPPLQRATASSANFTISDSHSGHTVGISNRFACCGRCSGKALNTSGITSPALRTITVSPIYTSLRRTSSSLCKVALVTVTPPTKTAFKRATGVIAPVRPTCTVISSTIVSASSAGNLCAIAQRGARDTKPSSFCRAKLLTLYTTPSISKGKSGRLMPISA